MFIVVILEIQGLCSIQSPIGNKSRKLPIYFLASPVKIKQCWAGSTDPAIAAPALGPLKRLREVTVSQNRSYLIEEMPLNIFVNC